LHTTSAVRGAFSQCRVRVVLLGVPRSSQFTQSGRGFGVLLREPPAFSAPELTPSRAQPTPPPSFGAACVPAVTEIFVFLQFLYCSLMRAVCTCRCGHARNSCVAEKAVQFFAAMAVNNCSKHCSNHMTRVARTMQMQERRADYLKIRVCVCLCACVCVCQGIELIRCLVCKQ